MWRICQREWCVLSSFLHHYHACLIICLVWGKDVPGFPLHSGICLCFLFIYTFHINFLFHLPVSHPCAIGHNPIPLCLTVISNKKLALFFVYSDFRVSSLKCFWLCKVSSPPESSWLCLFLKNLFGMQCDFSSLFSSSSFCLNLGFLRLFFDHATNPCVTFLPPSSWFYGLLGPDWFNCLCIWWNSFLS